MDTTTLVKEIIESWSDQNGNLKEVTNVSVKDLLTSLKAWWSEITSKEDFEAFVASIETLEWLTQAEKIAAKALMKHYADAYPAIYATWMAKMDAKETKAKSNRAQEVTKRWLSWQNKIESKENVSWATPEMQLFMDENHKRMKNNNEKNILPDADREALKKMNPSSREQNWEKIISINWSEYVSTKSADLRYSDMDKDDKRDIANLKTSTKFTDFQKKIDWIEWMSTDEHYDLMNTLGKQMGITQQITQEYINSVFDKHPNSNLPLDHDLGRILRALYVITGDRFVLPIVVNGKVVRSVSCSDDSAWIYDDNDDGNSVRPLSKIAGSSK